MQSGGLKKN